MTTGNSRIDIYSIGLVHCSVCARVDMTPEAITIEVNTLLPTGLDHGWTISTAPTFATGAPNPSPCEQRGSSWTHYLMVC